MTNNKQNKNNNLNNNKQEENIKPHTNPNQKQRIVSWLYPNQIEKINNIISNKDMKNHTEFISKAIDFYIGYLYNKDSTMYLSEHLLGAINGTLKNTENRMANNLFRLTVEMSIMMNILAAGLEIDEDELSKLRGRCVNEVKKTRGKVYFEDAIENQNG